MSREQVTWQLEYLENLDYIKSEFWNLINDYLKTQDKTEESNLFLEWIVWKAKKLNKEKFDTLIEFVNTKREIETWDNKLQLLNLWAILQKNEQNPILENIEINRDIPFEILWWFIEKKVYIPKLKKWWIPDAESKIVKHSLGYCIVRPSNKWPNNFEIELNAVENWEQQIINIEYNWWNVIYVLDSKWEYFQAVTIKKENNNNKRENINYWEIDINNWRIVIFLNFIKNHEHKRKKY